MKRFNAVLLALAVAGASASQPSAQQRPIEDFFRDFSAEWARGNPNQAVSTRYFTGELQDRLERQLTPLTSAWQRQRIDVARRGLAELRRMGRAAFIDQQAIAAELLEWQLDTIVQGESFIDFAFPLEQFQGANVRLVNTLTVAHPLRTEQDADNYLARLAQVGLRMQEAVAGARRIAADGILPPRFILRATIAQMEQFIASPPAQNPFVTAFEGRLAAAKAVPDQLRRAALRTEAERIVGAHVYPAWQNAIALLEQQLEQATDDAGLWRLRGGAEAYAYHLRRHTTTNLTAEEIHLIGLREVARIEAEMDAILKKLGRSEGSVNDRIAQLRRDLSYPLTDEGRMAIMADIDMTIRDAEKRSAEQFDVRPRAQVVSQAYPRFREATAAAGYTTPPLDGSRPGVFQIPLRDQYMTRFRLRSLVYHETIPGHHFQIALDLENDAQPRFRRVRLFGGVTALTEGWALYAERLAAESGWYEGDLEGLLGQLDAELFRARRLVVDTGLHAYGWTREQAIEYGIEASEVERYVVLPGQACSYLIGQLKLLELRDRVRTTLGNRFSIKQFHNVVLEAGILPLDMLERWVDAYIASMTPES